MISIVTDYLPGSEAAIASTRLADWLLSQDRDVRIFSRCAPGTGVHPGWDRAVRRCRRSTELSRDEIVIALGGRPSIWWPPLPGRNWVYVVDRPLRNKADRQALDGWARIVFPSRASADRYPDLIDRAAVVRWDAGMPGSCRGRFVEQDRVWVAVWFDRSSNRRIGRGPDIVTHLLLRPQISVRILRWRAWAAEDRRELRRLAAHCPGRIECLDGLSSPGIVAALTVSDVLLAPDIPARLTLPAAYASACGIPLVAPELAAYADIAGKLPIRLAPRDEGPCGLAETVDDLASYAMPAAWAFYHHEHAFSADFASDWRRILG